MKALKAEKIAYLSSKKENLEKEQRHLKAKEAKKKEKLDKHMEEIAKTAFLKVMQPSSEDSPKSAFESLEQGHFAQRSPVSHAETKPKKKKHRKKHHKKKSHAPQALAE
jgi:hypothetical protein